MSNEKTVSVEIMPGVKTYFVIGIGDLYLKDSHYTIPFGKYELTDNISEIDEWSLFDSYEKAKERLINILEYHRLFKINEVATNPLNQLKIKIIRKLDRRKRLWKDIN